MCQSCKPINVKKSRKVVLLALDIMFTLIIWHVSCTNHKVSDNKQCNDQQQQLVTEKYIQHSKSWVTTRKKNWSETNYNETKLGDFTLIILRDIFSHRISTETIFYLNSEWVRGLSIEIHGVYINFWQFQVKISLSCAFQLYWFIRTRCVA